jgi:ribonuclease Z
MHHRLSGVTWNLVQNTPGEYHVTAISDEELTTATLKTREAFAKVHLLPPRPWSRCVFRGIGYDLEAMILDHGTPSIAYLVREHPHLHVDQDRMRQNQLEDGPWLRFLKDPEAAEEMRIDIQDRSWSIAELRQMLLTETPGDSLAYLTDFCLDEAAEERVVDWLRDCRTVVCENNFRNADRSLAQRSRHMVAADVGRIAARARVQDLVIIHVSDRYQPHEHRRQLEEVRAAFPQARFPDHWHFFREH